MSAWLNTFQFGRPGYENSFDVNPGVARIIEQPVASLRANLAGDLKKSVIKTSAPVVQIQSNYLTKTTRDTFASLAGITDTFLSFQTRDDWQNVLEYNIPSTTTTVIIQNTSATRLSKVLVAGSFSSQITINHVYITANGTGTDYLNGGTYADATRTITLGTALPNATQPVYVTYTYKGWLVNMKSLNHTAQGGLVDIWNYDIELTGA